MIKDNTIYFGYGTVSVGSRWNHMLFQEIKPPVEIGEHIENKIKNGEIEFTGINKEIFFKSYDEIKEFERLLNTYVNLAKDGKRILKYNDLVLDFTNWNIGSYSVVKIHIDRIKTYLIGLMAC